MNGSTPISFKQVRWAIYALTLLAAFAGSVIAVDSRYAKAADVKESVRALGSGQARIEWRLLDKERFALEVEKKRRPLSQIEEERLRSLRHDMQLLEPEFRTAIDDQGQAFELRPSTANAASQRRP